MGVDGSMLALLDDASLETELHVKSALHRKKLMSHIGMLLRS
jgi:hypothetical protein